MAVVTLEPAPYKNALTSSPTDPTMSGPWQTWFATALVPRVETAAPSLVTTQVPATDAPIGTTVLVPLATGIYRVNWVARISQAATTSSSMQLSVAAIDGGLPVTQTADALTGNTVTTVGSGVFIVRCDQGTPLTYTVAYVSVGATPMQYTLSIVVEGLV